MKFKIIQTALLVGAAFSTASIYQEPDAVNTGKGESSALVDSLLKGDLDVLWPVLMSIPMFPVNTNGCALAKHAIHEKSLPKVRDLLRRSDFDPSACRNMLIDEAVNLGLTEIASALLEDKRSDLTETGSQLVKNLIRIKASDDLWALVIANTGFDLESHSATLIFQAIKENRLGLVQLILAQTNFSKISMGHALLAVELNRVGICKALLSDPRFNCKDSYVKQLIEAAIKKHVIDEIWDPLLCNQSLDLRSEGFQLGLYAAENGRLRFVRSLLAVDRFNPSEGANQVVLKALTKGHPDIACELLNDLRADLTVNIDFIIRATIEKNAKCAMKILIERTVLNDNQLEKAMSQVVKLDRATLFAELVKDPRCSTEDKGQEYLNEASGSGSANIVRFLLADPNVNPSADGNKALLTAVANRQHASIEVLLYDERIFETLSVGTIDTLLYQPTTATEKRLAWKWLLSYADCKEILNSFDKNRWTNMSKDRIDTVLTYFNKQNAPSVVNLIQRKLYARQILLSHFGYNFSERSGELMDLYDSLEEGFLADEI